MPTQDVTPRKPRLTIAEYEEQDRENRKRQARIDEMLAERKGK